MILIDTSAWIEFFRDSGPLVTAVDDALEAADAATCGPVLTEIRRGLRPAQRARVLPLLAGCHLLDQPDDLWIAAGDLGAALARRGSSVKTLDLLIAAYAIAHGTPLLTADSDFKAIAKANLGLVILSA